MTVAALLVGGLVTTACGPDESAAALQIVREHCPDDVLAARQSGGEHSPRSMAKAAKQLSEAMAEAATLDSRWKDIHRAALVMASYWRDAADELGAWADLTPADAERAVATANAARARERDQLAADDWAGRLARSPQTVPRPRAADARWADAYAEAVEVVRTECQVAQAS